MLSVRATSFISGIVIASITWAFSLHLYSKLSQNPNTVNPTMLVSEYTAPLEESVFNQKIVHDNRLFGHDNEQSGGKKNSNRLIQQLQPIPNKPAVVLGDGK